MADIDLEQYDPDPIKATYDVYIKPRISDDREIYVLQFPNRDAKQHYSNENESQPLKLRIKPEAGMLEVDVPLDVWRNFDREKGIKWGDAMKKSNMTKGGGSYGMPGAFGMGGAQPTGRGRARELDDDVNQQRLLQDYEAAVQQDHVLRKQTLGGQTVPNEDTTPQYMIGVWRENQLHLTPADQIVQMRPQFHHLDAYAEQERQLRARETGAAPARATEARAVHMTVKSSIDGEEDSSDNMAERIMVAQQEPWQHHRYIDEDSVDAWATFHENLFVGNEYEDKQELVEKVPKLSSVFQDSELLDKVSVTRDAAKLSRDKRGGTKGKGEAEDSDTSMTSDSPSDSDSE